MFIRPVGQTATPSDRPPGTPLLRGLLRQATPPDRPPLGPAPHGVGREADWEAGRGADWEAGRADGWEAGRADGREAGRADEPGTPEPEPTEGESPLPGGLVAELTQLAALASRGVLTPEEFTAAKARLLEK
ncbi:SHOCT domain-containing protein [Streptomyces sp. NPDC088097]|uniref:SHOCT domain-containing protein n=1 Tax=Streptomyces sp. NPDC088097 TaxID=3365823 RepID=UPI00382510DF